VNSFTRPVFWFSLIVVSLTTVTILLSVWWVGKHYTHHLSEKQIQRAEYFLSSYLHSQEVKDATAVKAITSDFGFKRTIADGDPATIQSMLENHAQRINIDLFILVDLQGSYITHHGPAVPPHITQELLTLLQTDQYSPRMVAIDNQFYRLYLTPVKAPHTIAYAISGVHIDIEKLAHIKSITGLELLIHSAHSGSLLSTNDVSLMEITHITSGAAIKSNTIWQRQPYIIKELQLESPPPYDVQLFISANLNNFYKDFDQLSRTIVLISLVLVLLVLVISLVLSRKLFKPLELLHKNLLQRASFDYLTGIHNRITSSELIQRQLLEVERRQKPLCIALADIDHFKSINDKYGHSAGDAVLIEITRRMAATLRKYDVIGRYGGEEFIVALQANTENSKQLFLRMKKAVVSKPVRYKGNLIPVTISFGVCTIDFKQYEDTALLEELIETADHALYAAKTNGRNQIALTEFGSGSNDTEFLV